MSKHIVFICTGNLCRSPLAEGILRHKLAERNIDSVTTSSAGTFGLDGQPAAALAIQVAAERGVDISDHIARHITPQILESADLVLGMEMEHVVEAGVVRRDTERKYRLLTDFGPPEMRGREIEDPYGAPRDQFAAAYDRIEACVDGLLDSLLEE